MVEQRQAPAALLPEKRPGSPVQEAGQASEPVWMGSENLSTEFQLRIVQPVATCNTDYAIPAANLDGSTARKFQKTTNRCNVTTTLNLEK